MNKIQEYQWNKDLLKRVKKKGLTWYDFKIQAEMEGGRLPFTKELEEARVDSKDDKWVPVFKSPGDKETGTRDAWRDGDENAWANIGTKKYQIEYPEWGLDARRAKWESDFIWVKMVERTRPEGAKARFVAVKEDA